MWHSQCHTCIDIDKDKCTQTLINQPFNTPQKQLWSLTHRVEDAVRDSEDELYIEV